MKTTETYTLITGASRPGRSPGRENLTFEEFFGIVSRETNVRRLMVHLPLAVMTTTSKLMVFQNSITGIPPAITPDFVKKYLNHWSLSSEKAITELGYKVTPFHQGVKMTLEWLRNEKK